VRFTDFLKATVLISAGAATALAAVTVARVSDGSQTTLVEYFPHLLPLEDEDASRELEKQFRRRKIEFILGANVEKSEIGGKGAKVTMKVANETRTVEAEIVLSALGRAPVTEDIGLEVTNIKTDKGFIKTDEMMRTTEPNVYAIGDIVPTQAAAFRNAWTAPALFTLIVRSASMMPPPPNDSCHSNASQVNPS